MTKNSSGYRIDKIKSINDAHKIITGSEGTLGIILSAKLKIKDKPKKQILYIIGYKTSQQASKECIKINKTNPSAMEFVDRTTINQIKFNFRKNINCLLFVEYDEEINLINKKLMSIITGDVIHKFNKSSEISQWWKYRDSSLHYSLKSIKNEKEHRM